MSQSGGRRELWASNTSRIFPGLVRTSEILAAPRMQFSNVEMSGVNVSKGGQTSKFVTLKIHYHGLFLVFLCLNLVAVLDVDSRHS